MAKAKNKSKAKVKVKGKRKRPSNPGRKGGEFERDLCRELTAWWTGDPTRDVIFWRTSQSGGRVTQRAKKNLGDEAAAHAADLTAIEVDGMPLTRLIAIEAKNGYTRVHPAAYLDQPPLVGAAAKAKERAEKSGKVKREDTFVGFVSQAKEAAERAGTRWWALVHHRPQRETVIYFPVSLYDELRNLGDLKPAPFPLLQLDMDLGGDRFAYVVGMTWKAFLAGVRPRTVRQLFKEYTNGHL